MLIDTHCHLGTSEYENLDELIINIFKNGIEKIIVSGYDVKSSNEALALAHKYPNIYATVGFHPQECDNIGDEDYEWFSKWLKDEKIVGIGEIGLDYYCGQDKKEKQIAMFRKQLSIASLYHMPVVIHNRDASEDVLNTLKYFKVKGVIHCFSDNLETAQKFIALGFYLGVGGIITFKNNKIKNVIVDIPIKDIVLETDSPYLTPDPFRGQKNSPLYLPLITKAVANIKGISYDEIASQTTLNAKQIFDFNR